MLPTAFHVRRHKLERNGVEGHEAAPHRTTTFLATEGRPWPQMAVRWEHYHTELSESRSTSRGEQTADASVACVVAWPTPALQVERQAAVPPSFGDTRGSAFGRRHSRSSAAWSRGGMNSMKTAHGPCRPR